MVSKLGTKITSKKAVIGVIGMGYIGLQLLDNFSRVGFTVLGYDYNQKKVESLRKKEGYLNFLEMSNLFSLMDRKKFIPSSDPQVLKGADVLIISVPTTLDRHGTPDLTNLRSAFEVVADAQKKDQLVVLQSSTYPGTTKEELLPILERTGLTAGKDFFLAHVPEIADIGNSNFTFENVPRIASGITPKCMEMAALLYRQTGCKVVACPSTEVAEAAKLLQNGFRLINISFINEMKVVFERMSIDIWEVIKAASVKPFGFMPFYPGPGIGGDCIPVAPLYLVWKAKVTGGTTNMLEEAKRINDSMAIYVVNKLIEGLNLAKKTLRGAKVLVLGVSYKKNVNDIRESPAFKILPLLKIMLANVHYHDPYIPEISNFPEYPGLHMASIKLKYDHLHKYDAVLIITDHDYYDWKKIVDESQLVVDTRNATDGIKGAKKKVIKA